MASIDLKIEESRVLHYKVICFTKLNSGRSVDHLGQAWNNVILNAHLAIIEFRRTRQIRQRNQVEVNLVWYKLLGHERKLIWCAKLMDHFHLDIHLVLSPY